MHSDLFVLLLFVFTYSGGANIDLVLFVDKDVMVDDILIPQVVDIQL